MKSEKEIQTEILREFGSKSWCRLWRQNTGVAVPLNAIRRLAGRVLTVLAIHRLPRVAFGVKGCADLSGILDDGRRLEIEVKKPRGRQSKAQKNFEDMIEKMGGVYILATCVDDVYNHLDAIGYEACA